ncbi:NTF2 and RRM domain-containing protein [Ceratocystis lukuohia]|uniref:NTF2 and RRM domain-containing protein n=1 Tax=Ceratocystis lukuohia TaxID=2019550 RepID=A0ABR4MEA2_9PEZI
MSTNGMSSGHNQHKASDSYNTTEQQSSNASPTQEPTKDEVGWFFVQQYYTTLSKSPEKLHLFYTKDSQFVYGEEAQVSNVSVGRSAIEERIRQLGFQDCKVRVNNVDSLSSFDNIVIQVIGETSNKQEPPRRFVQTFVLAKQTSGYFVLNDIWRFIIDDEEEELVPEQTATEAIAPDAEEKAVETTEPEMDEEKALEPQAEVASEPIVEPVAEPITEPAVEEEEEEVAQNSEAVAEPEEDAPESKPEESKPVAIPATKEETPAPVKPPAPTKAPEPVARPIPVVPMTWAGRAAAAAAAAAGPKAAAAGPKAAAPPAKTPAASSVAANKASAASQATATPTAADASSSSEWQTAGSDSKRQNRPQSMVGGSHEKETVNAYVKSVSDKINEADLKNTFSVFGQVVYCDINRAKNCAFVDFANMEGYKAAFTANPHIINGETIMVEARKPKTGAYGNYPGSNFNGRGGMGRGRGNFNDRGGYAPRGNFGRGRGGGAPRGRGPQISNA